jgi:hypothetical protein
MLYDDEKIKKAQKSLLIIDDFIEDKELLKEIENDKTFFPEYMGSEPRQLKSGNIYHSQDSKVFSPWMFWDGWWRSPADTLKKKVVQKIWKENLPCPVDDIVGFEYWTRTYSPGQYLPVHLDEDTFAYERNGEFRCPVLGAVYYPSISIDPESNPGSLLIHPGRVEIDREKKFQLKSADVKGNEEMLALTDFYSKNGQTDVITYRPNRLIIFDAGMVLHGTTPNGANGKRYIMGVNAWHKNDPPIGAQEGLFFVE